jgi:hypothetical protein
MPVFCSYVRTLAHALAHASPPPAAPPSLSTDSEGPSSLGMSARNSVEGPGRVSVDMQVV